MNFENIRSLIDTYIKKNGVEGITGEILNNILQSMLDDIDNAIISNPGGGGGSEGDLSKFATKDYVDGQLATLSDHVDLMWTIDSDLNLVTDKQVKVNNNIIATKEVSAGGAGAEADPEGGQTSGEYKMYTHYQEDAAKVWTIVHGLGKYPNVKVVDSYGELCYGDVVYKNIDSVEITFGAAFGGYAYLD